MRIAIAAMSAALALSWPYVAAAKEVASQEVQSAQLLDDIETTLRANYVFADKVGAIMAELRAKHAAGEYAEATEPKELADLLTGDLIDATGDFHFFVGHDPKPETEEAYPEDEGEARRRTNFDFKSLKILPGNVGYIRFDYFANPDDVYQTVVGAMRFVENSDALIIDMRYNRGGHMGTAQLVMSHLFSDEKDVELFDYFYNDEGKTIEREMWVLHGIQGKRMPDVPVYVLTSTTTFSAGEWFAYSLGELDRATIVGRTTAGAAHPVSLKRVNDNFVMQVPVGVIHGPVSNTDFEGKGVTPDHDVASHDALGAAYKMALAKIAEGKPTSGAAWHLPFASVAELSETETQRDKQDIVGSYEGRRVFLDGETLIYSWRDRFALALTPLGEGLFAVEGSEDYRLRLMREGGRVTGLERQFKDGNTSVYRRIE